ncbi:S-layer homology domain-containing protein [Candidatus Peregrinibacteria bacterium]|nr:S-layer homology domain-containing protein [Candidatus Peregrinibacteria bacterium]
MRLTRVSCLSGVLLLSMLSAGGALAAVFPDVPDGHVYQGPIERLVGLKVINGNPDGRFNPERSVNRAEMLTMLYRALNRTPAAVSAKCFPDVMTGSWYELVVCDAAAHHFVDGYSDGTFRPQKEVNRVEALKMITNMFSMPVAELTAGDRTIVKFVDVSVSAWYTKYLYASFTNGILPIAGQGGPRFYPDAPLLRGEAAAYIDNALQVHLVKQSSSEAQSSPASTAAVASAASSSATSVYVYEPVIKEVDFPFSDSGNFDGKRNITYRFALKAATVVDASVSLGDKSGSVTCRIFKLSDQGLSAEYYLGFQYKGACSMRVALSAGSYQMDVQPSIPGSAFNVFTKSVTSDGNDGFREAKVLIKGIPRSGIMTIDNYADWYTFTVAAQTLMTLELSMSARMDAIIYPMENVDLFGFTGPEINQSYNYPPGTYYVGVRRGDPEFGKETYSILLK